MLTEDYKVRLDAFEGPLDLLLYLVRKAEVDIHDVPIATIADQYLAHLEGIERVDIDLAGEFLVMAATLIEIKARAIAPMIDAPRGEGDEAGAVDEDLADPREELVRRLIAYKRTRDAADELADRAAQWSRRSPVGPLSPDADALLAAAEERLSEVDLDDVGVYDLVEAFARIVTQVDFGRMGEHRVRFEADDTPIEEHIANVGAALRSRAPDELGRRRMPFRDLFTGKGKGEMIGLFLALLELMRRQEVGAAQDAEGGEIWIHLRTDAAPGAQIEPKPIA